MQQFTVYLYLQTALHVSGGISTYHQQLMSLNLQYLALLRPLLLPVVDVIGWQLQFPSSHVHNTVNTVISAADDGWRYHRKYVEQFADINELYNAASCWVIIVTNIKRCTDH